MVRITPVTDLPDPMKDHAAAMSFLLLGLPLEVWCLDKAAGRESGTIDTADLCIRIGISHAASHVQFGLRGSRTLQRFADKVNATTRIKATVLGFILLRDLQTS